MRTYHLPTKALFYQYSNQLATRLTCQRAITIIRGPLADHLTNVAETSPVGAGPRGLSETTTTATMRHRTVGQ